MLPSTQYWRCRSIRLETSHFGVCYGVRLRAFSNGALGRDKALLETFHSSFNDHTKSGVEFVRPIGRILRKSFFWAWLDTICQYRRSRIGPFWETINVAVMIGGLTLVSSAIFGGSMSGRAGYIGAGIIAWSAISAMITEGPSAFVRYGVLIT